MKIKKITGWILALSVTCVAVGLTCVVLGGGREELRRTDVNTSISYISCVASQPQNAFFSSGLASSADQKIKIIFDEDGVNKIDYTYTGEFSDAKSAEEESDRMLFDYNTYMGEQTSYGNLALSPAFSAVENELVVNLFISKKYFDSNTAKLIFLTSDEYSEIMEIKDVGTMLLKMKEIYESKMFVCEIAE